MDANTAAAIKNAVGIVIDVESEMAVLLGIIVSEMRAQSGFDTTLVEKHVMDRVTALEGKPEKAQAAQTLQAFDRVLQMFGPNNTQ